MVVLNYGTDIDFWTKWHTFNQVGKMTEFAFAFYNFSNLAPTAGLIWCQKCWKEIKAFQKSWGIKKTFCSGDASLQKCQNELRSVTRCSCQENINILMLSCCLGPDAACRAAKACPVLWLNNRGVTLEGYWAIDVGGTLWMVKEARSLQMKEARRAGNAFKNDPRGS